MTNARDVAQTLSVDALERDLANESPVAEVDLLRKSGLLTTLVPTELGGAGETWRAALENVRQVASGDGSIAQLLGYHYVNQANLWLNGTSQIQRRLGGENWFWGDSVNPIDPDLTLTPDGDGYRLNGTKNFSTGASVADAIVIAAVADEPLLAVVFRGDDGISYGGDWDNLGQRLSASGSVTFTDTPVRAENVIGSLAAEKSTPRGSLITPAIQAVFGNLYLGIAQGALATARDYTRTSARPWTLGGVEKATDEPYVLATYGQLVARLAAVEALADRIGDRLSEAFARGNALTWDERGELAVEVAGLKVVSTEVSLEVTSTIHELTGARSSGNRYGFDRFWRNVRTHTLHDPVAYKRREVGDHYVNGTHPQFTLYT